VRNPYSESGRQPFLMGHHQRHDFLIFGQRPFSKGAVRQIARGGGKVKTISHLRSNRPEVTACRKGGSGPKKNVPATDLQLCRDSAGGVAAL